MSLRTAASAGSAVAVLRAGKCHDVGYPQWLERSDGRLVCVCYWSDADGDCQRIEATTWSP